MLLKKNENSRIFTLKSECNYTPYILLITLIMHWPLVDVYIYQFSICLHSDDEDGAASGEGSNGITLGMWRAIDDADSYIWIIKPFYRQIIQSEFSPTWSCVSLTRSTTSKWVKIIQIWQNGGQLFSNIADWCHVLSFFHMFKRWNIMC